MLGEVMAEAGVPRGVCNLVFGYGGKVGPALVSHPRVPLISFTGGTITGNRYVHVLLVCVCVYVCVCVSVCVSVCLYQCMYQPMFYKKPPSREDGVM